MRHPLLARIASFVSWHKRALAAVSAAVCVIALGATLAPPVEPGVPTVVAAHTIEAGATLSPADVKLAEVPSRFRGTDALSTLDEAIGKIAVSALSAGSHLTPGAVLGDAPRTPGMRYVFVRVADEQAAKLIKAGDRVTLIGAGTDGQPVTLASAVRVAATPRSEPGGALTAERPAPILIVEVPAKDTPGIAMAAFQRALTVVLG